MDPTIQERIIKPECSEPMRELTLEETEAVSGGGAWTEAGKIVGGVLAVTGGTIYTVETGGVGGVLGGGAAIAGGMAAIASGFSGLHQIWYGT